MPVPDGLAGLTLEWLAEALAGLPAFRGTSIRTARATVIGEGYGLDGTVVRLDLGTDSPEAPATIVAKLAGAKRGGAEIRFYAEIAPRMPIRLARFYSGSVDEEAGRAVLLLEHIAPAEQGDAILGASREQILAVSDAAARFHAEFLGGEEAEPDFPPPWNGTADHIAGRVAGRRERFLERHGADLSARERECVESLPERLARAATEFATAPPTLIHGDLHLDNVLFPASGEPVLLDWAEARRGPAVMDCVRILVEGMTVERRRRHEEEVLAAYAGARAAAGRPLPDAGRWRGLMRAAFAWHLAYAVAWAGAEDPGYGTPRVREIVQSLVRNTAAAAADHLSG